MIARSPLVALAAVLLLLGLTASATAQGAERLTVDAVTPAGAADEAGVRPGDQLLEIAGTDVKGMEDIDRALRDRRPGDVVRLTVLRDQTRRELTLTLGSHPTLPGRPLLGVTLAASAGRPLPDRPVSSQERRQVLEQVADHLAGGYIYEAKGRELAESVREAAAGDRFATAQRLPAFVHSVNDYLLELSEDRHLRIGHQGGDGPAAGPARIVVRTGPGGPNGPDGPHGPPGVEGHHGPPPGGPAEGAPRRQPPLPQSGQGDAPAMHGFAEATVLEGNLGYLDLRGFSGSEAAKPAADEAMLRLADTDALILDLRYNGGGAPYMVRYLSGFLFAEPTHLASTMMRGWDEPRERWTLQDGRPTDAFVDKPVYVLTSHRTFSAAESFTFGLKINDRITIVGERTGGGGHFGETIDLQGGFRLFLPRGRTYDPKTGRGWEAEGIAPDIEVPSEEALEAAIRAAKARLG